MAKKFLASEYEIRNLIDGDIGVPCEVRKDWYRQRYTVYTEGLLSAPLRLELPLALPRDRFEISVIPGGASAVEDTDIIELLKKDLGVGSEADYIFFVMTGRLYSAHDDDPMRFVLVEPRRARDVMLMASWHSDTAAPTNRYVEQSLCDSPVAEFAIFEKDEHGCCASNWVISATSPLGKRLVAEAGEQYAERLQSGIEHFRDYTRHCIKTRDDLWTRLYADSHSTDERQPTARLMLYDFYLHAEWYDDDGEACDEYYFYTNIGVASVLDLTRYWESRGVVVGLIKIF